MRRERRGHWYLLTGVVFGMILGLLYAWLIDPVEYLDTSPAALRADFKDRYRALIALSYVANGNLPRAQSRLQQLRDTEISRTLAEQAQRTLAEGQSPEEARALGLLAVALGRGPTPIVTPLPVTETAPLPTPTSTLPGPSPTSPEQPSLTATESLTTTTDLTTSTQVIRRTLSPTSTPAPANTPLPTRTPTSTPGAPFVLRENTFICDRNLTVPLVQVLTKDASGNPVAGVEVIVNWEGGEDHFFTGLKPELGAGYADFTMTAGVIYTLRLAGSGQTIPNLTPAECETTSGGRYWGSWLLIFEQP